MSGVGEIGARLKAAREAKGLTLDAVQQALKIRLRYLEAIEAGQLGEIPGLVYARGFIRTYARYLGVDVQEELAALTPQANPTPAQAQVATSVVASAGAVSGSPRAFYLAAGVVAVLALVLLLVHPWSGPVRPAHASHRHHVLTAKSSKKSKGKGSAPAPATPTVTATGAATAVESGGETIAGEGYTVTPGPLTATLTLDGPCWVEVDADGTYSQSTLTTGVYTYRASQTLQIVLGRPGSVASLSLDGHLLGPYSGTTPTAIVARSG